MASLAQMISHKDTTNRGLQKGLIAVNFQQAEQFFSAMTNQGGPQLQTKPERAVEREGERRERASVCGLRLRAFSSSWFICRPL